VCKRLLDRQRLSAIGFVVGGGVMVDGLADPVGGLGGPPTTLWPARQSNIIEKMKKKTS